MPSRSFLFCRMFVAACLAASASSVGAQDIPDGRGKEPFVRIRSSCHALDDTVSRLLNREAWQQIILEMQNYGAKGTKDEFDAILDYVTTVFGTVIKINVNKATALELQKGLSLTDEEAEAILKYRKSHDPFKEWRDLLKVDGVDGKKVEAAKDRLSF
jgi:competence protein ComEA